MVEGGIKGALDLGATAAVGAVIPGGGSGLSAAEDLEKAATQGVKGAHVLEEAAEVKKLPELPPRRGNGGRGGGPEHARIQARLKEELGGMDEQVIVLPNGKKRIVDVLGPDDSIHQIGDMRSRGGNPRPSARERGAIEDMRKTHPEVDINFHDKLDQHPKLVNPDLKPDWQPSPRKHRRYHG